MYLLISSKIWNSHDILNWKDWNRKKENDYGILNYKIRIRTKFRKNYGILNTLVDSFRLTSALRVNSEHWIMNRKPLGFLICE